MDVRRWIGLAVSAIVLVLLAGGARAAEAPSANEFLIASDIHFNPFADPALAADLNAAAPTQWEAILNRSKLTAFSQYSEDTNWWLLRSALNAMRATLPHPALVMITGDLLAHRFADAYLATTHDSDREHYRAFVRKTIEFLALQLRERFAKAKILMTPGNNDNDCGDYDIDASGPFLSDTAEPARRLAQADTRFLDEWKALGSYATGYPAIPGIRVLSLNTVFFSHKYHAASFPNGCSEVDSDAADRNLAWLKANLAQARKAHERVWLMFHIPPGIDGYSTMVRYEEMPGARSPEQCTDAIVPMWDPIWTSKFDGLLEEFQSTVAAGFAGHDHTDDFRVIGGAGAGAFVLIDPPISPIYGQNPAFRVVTFRSNGDLVDQSTYYLTNLKTASSRTPGRWMREYRFREQWQQPLDVQGLKAVDDRIESDPAARAEWLRLYNVSSSAARVPASGVRALYCAIGSLDPVSYRACYCP